MKKSGTPEATADSTVTVTPVLVADLQVEGEVMPVYVHVIDHPQGRVLVDTGMTELHPLVVEAFHPTLYPLDDQDLDVAGIDMVVNTHLHADHCGGNQLFAGRPVYVQRRELEDARSQDDYTIREWVDAPGVQYVPVDGELELLPGVRLVPAPGHTPGSQVVVVTSGAGRPVVICGDAAVWFGQLNEPDGRGTATHPRSRPRRGLAGARARAVATVAARRRHPGTLSRVVPISPARRGPPRAAEARCGARAAGPACRRRRRGSGPCRRGRRR